MTRIAAAILILTGLAQAAAPIRDEALRLRVLKTIFPEAQISAGKHEYSIIAPVQPEEELSALDITGGLQKPVSDRRLLDLRLYRSGAQLVAIVTYSFKGANPARCCLVIGKVVLLTGQGNRVLSTVRKSPHAFTNFTDVQFIRDSSTDRELVLVAMNGGGAGNAGEESMVLLVASRRLVPLAVFTTAFSGDSDPESDVGHLQEFKMTLDTKRTHFGTDRRLWFVKKTTMDSKLVGLPKIERIPIKIGTQPVEIE